MSSRTGPLTARLAILGLVVCILQLAAVSQLTLFGAHADLVPLVVAACGLLLGSLPGAPAASSWTPR